MNSIDTTRCARDPSLVVRSIVLALLVALPASYAGAQACEEGRVSSPATAGRCCWPGQSWSEAHARCSGPPTCPEALVAHADDCVPRILGVPAAPSGYAPMVEDFDGVPEHGLDVPTSSSIAPATSSSIAPATASSIAPDGSLPVAPPPPSRGPVTQTAWPPSPPDLELALFSPRLERGTDEGLLIAGLLTFAGGYLVGILGGVIDESAQNCGVFSPGFGSFMTVSCGTWGYAFIPIAGGIAAGTVQVNSPPGFSASNRNPAVGLGVGIPAAVIQVGGIVLAILALAGHTDRAVSTGRPEGFEISLTPWADDTGGGAWLDLRF